MGQGLQVWNAAGQLVMDTADLCSRLSGTVPIPAGATGSATVPNASQGTIWYAVFVANGSHYSPGVSVSGGTISWGPSNYFGPPVDAILVYGVY